MPPASFPKLSLFCCLRTSTTQQNTCTVALQNVLQNAMLHFVIKYLLSDRHILYLFHKYKPRNNLRNKGITFPPTCYIRRKRQVNGVQFCENPSRFDVRVVCLANTHENIQPSRGFYYKRSRKNSLKG